MMTEYLVPTVIYYIFVHYFCDHHPTVTVIYILSCSTWIRFVVQVIFFDFDHIADLPRR